MLFSYGVMVVGLLTAVSTTERMAATSGSQFARAGEAPTEGRVTGWTA